MIWLVRWMRIGQGVSRDRWKLSTTSATEVERSIPPSRASRPSPRRRSRTDDRASTAWNRMPAAVSSSARPARVWALCRSTCGAADKVEHDQRRRRAFGPRTRSRNRVAHVIHVEIDQAGFGPEDQHAGNQLVVRMPLAIGEPPRAGNASEEGDVRTRRATEQLHERDDRADHHAAQQAGAEHAERAPPSPRRIRGDRRARAA